ncbi:MAG: N-acetylmuramoyl-L-alanine amidase [Pseudomonadota bacterium]
MIFQGSARYPVDEIVIHCAATGRYWMRGQPLTAKRKEIDRWYREERGWRKIGYHHLIDRDGATLPGRAENGIGAGVEDYNRGVIHICLIGGAGSAATDTFERNFTATHDPTLRGLIDSVRSRTAITRSSGHNDHAAKACPGSIVRNRINRA